MKLSAEWAEHVALNDVKFFPDHDTTQNIKKSRCKQWKQMFQWNPAATLLRVLGRHIAMHWSNAKVRTDRAFLGVHLAWNQSIGLRGTTNSYYWKLAPIKITPKFSSFKKQNRRQGISKCKEYVTFCLYFHQSINGSYCFKLTIPCKKVSQMDGILQVWTDHFKTPPWPPDESYDYSRIIIEKVRGWMRSHDGGLHPRIIPKLQAFEQSRTT